MYIHFVSDKPCLTCGSLERYQGFSTECCGGIGHKLPDNENYSGFYVPKRPPNDGIMTEEQIEGMLGS